MPRRKQQQIEQEHGRPIRDVLADLYERHQSQEKVALELGVSQGTVSLWMKLNDLKGYRVVKGAGSRERN